MLNVLQNHHHSLLRFLLYLFQDQDHPHHRLHCLLHEVFRLSIFYLMLYLLESVSYLPLSLYSTTYLQNQWQVGIQKNIALQNHSMYFQHYLLLVDKLISHHQKDLFHCIYLEFSSLQKYTCLLLACNLHQYHQHQYQYLQYQGHLLYKFLYQCLLLDCRCHCHSLDHHNK